MREIYIIAHDLRSTHNVGSLFRTAEGIGAKKIFLTGYTPYPRRPGDSRLPHLSEKLHAQIDKTALGATETLLWDHEEDVFKVMRQLEHAGVHVAALEQTGDSIPLHEYNAPEKIALLLGTEVTGLPEDILNRVKTKLEIPMLGKKESYNVIQAAAMALYQIRFY